MQALTRAGQSAFTTCTVSRGISATAFKRDLLRLWWCFQQVVFFKTAHSLQSRGLRSGLLKGQFLALMKARRFLRSHSWVVLALWAGAESCWGTHSWPLKSVILNKVSQLLVACPLWCTQHQFHPFFAKMKKCHPLMGHPPPNYDVGRVMAPLHPQNATQGMFEHKSCCSGCYTAPRWWRFSRPWGGCFCAHSWHTTGGDALLLSVTSPSKQE